MFSSMWPNNMKTIKNLLLSITLLFAFTATANAAIPWGTTQQVTGSTPSPTSFSSAPVIIDLMTGNTTMGSLSGGTAGGFYTIILEQDGTGSRTFTPPTNFTGLPASTPAAVTTANGYVVYIVQAVGANYNVVSEYDNVNLADSYKVALATAGTTVAPNATQAQTAQYAPGVATTTACVCDPATYPATWQVGIFTECVPTTNTITCQVVNPDPTNTHTPAAVSLNIRILQP